MLTQELLRLMNDYTESLEDIEAYANRLPQGITARKVIKRLLFSVRWYKLRWNAIREWADTLPEPQRTELYNMLANGKPQP